jgi:triosephosphate isomerase
MIIVGNWKAYVESQKKAKILFATAKKLSATSRVKIVLAVPGPYLGLLSPANRSKVAFAAQDVSTSSGGAATGEVTAGVLQDLKVSYVIVGHSERRAMGETDAVVSEKIQHALAHKITPIVCIGERERDIDAYYLKFLRAQIHEIFHPLSLEERQQIILAYEPIWAIGKNAANALPPSDLTEMVLYIRKMLVEYLTEPGASKIKILYGGSVEPSNSYSLAKDTGVDGFLLGHASADSDIFSALVKALPKAGSFSAKAGSSV